MRRRRKNHKRIKYVAAGIVGAISFAMTTFHPSIAQANAFTQKDVTMNGSVLSKPFALVASDGSHLTTYMPIWYIGRALKDAGFDASWNGTTHRWNLSTSKPTNFSSISVGSGDAAIVVNGVLVKRINTYVEHDPAAGQGRQPTVYMPIYYVQQLLRAAGIHAAWNGHTWSIATAGSQTLTKPVVLGFVTHYGGSTSSLQDYEKHTVLNQMSTFTGAITSSGSLTGSLYTDAAAYAHARNEAAYVSVTDTDGITGSFDPRAATAVLTNGAKTKTLVQNVTHLVQGTTFAGINIDFEMLPASDRFVFGQFLATLSSHLHAIGKKLTVDVPAVTDANSAYDYATIGAKSDAVILMAYDYSYPGGPAGPIAPIGWVKRVLSYATNAIPAKKVVLGIPAYAYDWSAGKTTALTLSQVDNLLSNHHITPSWNATDEVPYFSYNENGIKHTVYYENTESTRDELALVSTYHIAGIAVWRLGLEDNHFWQAVDQFAGN